MFPEPLFDGHFRLLQQRLGGRNIFQPLFHLVEGVDNGFEGGTLFTQRLCAFGFVPDIRLFQLGVYFFQTLFLGVIVKDTP